MSEPTAIATTWTSLRVRRFSDRTVVRDARRNWLALAPLFLVFSTTPYVLVRTGAYSDSADPYVAGQLLSLSACVLLAIVALGPRICSLSVDEGGVSIRNRWTTSRVSWSDVQSISTEGRVSPLILTSSREVPLDVLGVHPLEWLPIERDKRRRMRQERAQIAHWLDQLLADAKAGTGLFAADGVSSLPS